MSDDDQPGSALDAEAARFLKPGETVLCWACRPKGRCQFGIKSVMPDGARAILAKLDCPTAYEGGPGVVHGGWTAAVFDEVLGHMGPLNGALTVTGSLSVDYLKPVPVGREVEIRARVVSVEGRKWNLEAEMTLTGSDTLLARARGLFIERRPDHFERTRRWMDEEKGG